MGAAPPDFRSCRDCYGGHSDTLFFLKIIKPAPVYGQGRLPAWQEGRATRRVGAT